MLCGGVFSVRQTSSGGLGDDDRDGDAIQLAGEVRAIPQLERRVAECARLGFGHVLCPKDSAGRVRAPEGIVIHPVDTVAQAFAVLDVLRRHE